MTRLVLLFVFSVSVLTFTGGGGGRYRASHVSEKLHFFQMRIISGISSVVMAMTSSRSARISMWWHLQAIESHQCSVIGHSFMSPEELVVRK